MVNLVKCKFRLHGLKRAFVGVCVGLFLMSAVSPRAFTAGVDLKADPKKVPLELDGVGVKEHLGEIIDLKLKFTGVDGKAHELGENFQSRKPTLLNLVYFECPMLCTMVLNGLNEGMKGLDWSVGKEFNVVTISIDPKDGVGTAKAKRDAYLNHYLGKEAGNASEKNRSTEAAFQGWNFYTGDTSTIEKLAGQLGFEYKYDKIQKQFAHPAVTFVLTPEGKISRYLYGITYRPRDLRLALNEASQGKIGNVFDRLLMFCYHYEPSSRGYTLQAVRVMQAGGAGTLALLGGYLIVFWSRQRKGKRNDKAV